MLDHPKVLVKEVFCYFTLYCGYVGWYKVDTHRGVQVYHVRPGSVCKVGE